MAAKKRAARKKVVARAKRAKGAKKAAKKAGAAKRSRAGKKKAAAGKKKTKKKTKKKVAKKQAARKKTAKKKTSKKKAAKKKPAGKKVAKKPARKKATRSKKKLKKKTAAKKAAKKKASSKKVSKKASARKKATAAKKQRKKSSKPSGKPKPARARRRRGAAQVLDSDSLIHGIEPYDSRRSETYMSEQQLEHFRRILLAWKRELMEEVDRTVHHMQDEAANFPDPNDRATQESEFGLELRTRDRERKLLKKIDSALERIDDGSYGFCEETGEEIGLKRLEARPVATLCVEAQERRELAERQYRDRDDQYR
jgi:DnaK suppressor protein